MKMVWDEIEQRLVELYSLSHNRTDIRGSPINPAKAAKEEVGRIRSALDTVTPENYYGRRIFLRVVGNNNNVYSGAWWFDASILDELDVAFSRIYFSHADRNRRGKSGTGADFQLVRSTHSRWLVNPFEEPNAVRGVGLFGRSR